MCVLSLKLETDIKPGGKVTWARVRGEVQFYSKASPQFLRHKLRHKRRIKKIDLFYALSVMAYML